MNTNFVVILLVYYSFFFSCSIFSPCDPPEVSQPQDGSHCFILIINLLLYNLFVYVEGFRRLIKFVFTTQEFMMVCF